MQKFLVRHFVKNYEDVRNPKVRAQFGRLGSIVGIIINLLLFVTKFAVGTLSNSVSITADAINNLSDASSSVISLISFRLSTKPADSRHPFGHARIEYITSAAVAVTILMIGFELLKTSFEKILHPETIVFNYVMIFVLVFSILAKFWLCRFNTSLGKHIDSSVMRATAADSMSDVVTTSAVLASTILSRFISVQLDGYMGIGVAIFIMISGIRILKETLDHILGRVPSDEAVSMIEKYIRKYDGIIGIHDLVIHDYGPNSCFASVHAEVNAKVDILKSHDLIDNIERDIALDYGIHLVIHLDPIVIDDPVVTELYHMTKTIVSGVDDSLSMHDFRVVRGTTHSNLIFDIMVPYQCKKSDTEILDEIKARIHKKGETLYAVITVDRAYVSSHDHD